MEKLKLKKTFLDNYVQWIVLLCVITLIAFKYSNNSDEKGPDSKYYPGSTDLSLPREPASNSRLDEKY